MESNKKTIGIIGGMGSEATSDLFRSIVNQTQASGDGDHLPIIIYNNPFIPDRSDFILGKGPDP
ncbi:MAG: aspartate racemase, partial [Bacteroidota bacterium]|nr:aspartate racemase [Bacteroidota bacterium]